MGRHRGDVWLLAAAMAHFAPDLVSSYYGLVLLALALGWRVASKQVSGLLPVKASRLTFVMRVSAVAIVVLGLAGQEAWGTLRAWPAALLAVGSACFWLVDAAMGGPPIGLAGVTASVVFTAGVRLDGGWVMMGRERCVPQPRLLWFVGLQAFSSGCVVRVGFPSWRRRSVPR